MKTPRAAQLTWRATRTQPSPASAGRVSSGVEARVAGEYLVSWPPLTYTTWAGRCGTSGPPVPPAVRAVQGVSCAVLVPVPSLVCATPACYFSSAPQRTQWRCGLTCGSATSRGARGRLARSRCSCGKGGCPGRQRRVCNGSHSSGTACAGAVGVQAGAAQQRHRGSLAAGGEGEAGWWG